MAPALHVSIMICLLQDYSCMSNPYSLEIQTKATATGTAVTMTITGKPLPTSYSGCYADLVDRVHRVALLTCKLTDLKAGVRCVCR
eukprot:353985-Chlamydomonas_euryale.AAC.6